MLPLIAEFLLGCSLLMLQQKNEKNKHCPSTINKHEKLDKIRDYFNCPHLGQSLQAANHKDSFYYMALQRPLYPIDIYKLSKVQTNVGYFFY